ncbi:MAG: hypothetical protein KZQ80_01970 [Candidatus Thiodiazotropha sp. (ex Monitilora ramsayi)]|nr:hypothetical protein [Candidatus Thiodiazotropha sp. (ex Monitilora ramsayi)]
MKQDLRHYNFSDLPAVVETVDGELTDGQRQLLETLYAEVCTTWRALHDVRFKLLGLVPFVTVGILVFLLPEGESTRQLSSWQANLIPTVGLVVTLGLLVYELRNSELYNDLISRGRRIEAELGVKTGVFRGRRKPGRQLINHSTAIRLIYGAAIFGWGASILAI